MKAVTLSLTLGAALLVPVPTNAASASVPSSPKIEKVATMEVVISGRVNLPGRYTVEVGADYKSVLYKAGGFKEDAKAIFVLRENASGEVEAFEVDMPAIGGPKTRPFPLKRGDEIHVPQKG